jgi:MFS family permease
MIHGRVQEAEDIVSGVEQKITQSGAKLPEAEGSIRIRTRSRTRLSEIWRTMAFQQRSRSLLGLTLMIAQAFFYNAIFFTYALVLGTFYNVPEQRVGLYLFPFALGNFVGPLVLGKLFDSVGRKTMITATYAISGVLLGITGVLFQRGALTAHTQAIAWTVIFFVASSAASSAYLTVSEVFPLEIRGLAIAIFYACGTLVGGVAAPSIFGVLIQSHSRTNLMYGYLAGASLMLVAAAVEALIGVKAERTSLEAITNPLSASA